MSPKFEDEHLVIITANEEVAMFHWGDYILKDWDRLMKENTKLLVLAGVHGKEDGGVASDDEMFIRHSEKQIVRIKKKKGNYEDRGIEIVIEDVSLYKDGESLNEGKFAQKVKEVRPTVILLAICWSKHSQLNDILRSAGVYSSMIMREERAQVTESRHVWLDEQQEELIERIGEGRERNLFLYSSSGCGKTIMLTEGLKIKVSQYKRLGREVRVYVTTYDGSSEHPLMRDLQDKYLPDLSEATEVRFMTVRDLAKELGVKYDLFHPKSTMASILSRLSSTSPSSPITLLLADEVQPMSYHEDGERCEECGVEGADWSAFHSYPGVDFLIALQTWSHSESLYQVTPPEHLDTLSRRLRTPHRNCRQVRRLLLFTIHHLGSRLLSPEGDEEPPHLPPGLTPVWLRRTPEVPESRVLEEVARRAGGMGVTVLYDYERAPFCNFDSNIDRF